MDQLKKSKPFISIYTILYLVSEMLTFYLGLQNFNAVEYDNK